MGIFVLSKDQTFRICATFLDPAKFFILVIHLIKQKLQRKCALIAHSKKKGGVKRNKYVSSVILQRGKPPLTIVRWHEFMSLKSRRLVIVIV